MKSGFKSNGHLARRGTFVGKRVKSYPSKMFAHGFAGYPHISEQLNPYKVDITGKNQLRTFGDSITLGSAASPLSLGYANRISTFYPQFTDVVNYAENGRGVWRNCQLIQTASWNSGPTNTVWITWMAGLNDMARTGYNSPLWQRTKNKIYACLKSAMLKGLQGSVNASGSAAVTRSPGTFAAYFANTVGGLYQQLDPLPNVLSASFSSSAGATWTWVATFKHFYIQFIGWDGTLYTPAATANILVDGVLVGTFSAREWYDGVTDGAYDNGRGPVPMDFYDFSNGSHTVTVVQTSGTVVIDFFATISDNQIVCPAFTYIKIPYLVNFAFYGGGGSNAASEDIERNVTMPLVRFFKNRGYNYGAVDTNKFYSLNNCSPDGTHPATSGHSQILRGVLNGVKRPFITYIT